MSRQYFGTHDFTGASIVGISGINGQDGAEGVAGTGNIETVFINLTTEQGITGTTGKNIYNIPSGTLAASGDAIEFLIWGDTGAAVDIDINYGGTTIGVLELGIASAHWVMQGWIVYEGPSSQKTFCLGGQRSSSISAQRADLAQDNSQPQQLEVRGDSGGAAWEFWGALVRKVKGPLRGY